MALRQEELDGFVSLERGEVARQIFSDPDIFEEEMELIFGRAWLFCAHESMLKKSGDFFEVPMGKDNVLIVRQKDGSLKGLLNTCTHRGNAVCRAEEGNTKNFMCTYHGWTFAIDGELIGVPGFENLYHSELDKASLGLPEVAQLQTYKGFIFATMDPTAPPLYDYLGTTGRLGLDLIAERGDMEVVPGIQKFVINCNWKFAVDNLFDWYHAPITHMSAFQIGMFPTAPAETIDETHRIDTGGSSTPDGDALEIPSGGGTDPIGMRVILGEYGHAIAGPMVKGFLNTPDYVFNQDWRKNPKAAEVLGPIGVDVAGHPNIFPTCWVTNLQICLRVPRTPGETELWWFTFVDKDLDAEQRAGVVFMANHVFGPAGLLEQEDGENWAQSTMQTNGHHSMQVPQALKMDIGRGKVIKEHGLARVDGEINEHAQLWTYAAWAQWMKGLSWDALRQETEPPDLI
jgi:3-phenylpropionate/trans-cinnamate dioxygenase alpha subunit